MQMKKKKKNKQEMHCINLMYKFNHWELHELTQADKDRHVQSYTNLLKYQYKGKILDQILFVMESGFISTTQQLLSHPPYRSDIIPSDFYLSLNLQLHHDSVILNSAQGIENEFDLFFNLWPPSFWTEDFEKLPNRWQKIIDLGVDCYPH